MAHKDSKDRVSHWEKLFSDDKEVENLKNRKRLDEIKVAQSELDSLSKGSRIFTGESKTVFFQADLAETKSALKKEQSRLRKISPALSAELSF